MSSSVLEYIPRQTRDLSISGRRVYLKFKQRRYRCSKCNKSFLEQFSTIDAQTPAAHYTKRYEDWIVEQVRGGTIQKVAREEGLNWETVNNICYRVAKRRGYLQEPEVVRYLSIDEIALKKGHKQYALIISAPEQGRVLAVLEGRTKEVLSNWLQKTWTKS